MWSESIDKVRLNAMLLKGNYRQSLDRLAGLITSKQKEELCQMFDARVDAAIADFTKMMADVDALYLTINEVLRRIYVAADQGDVEEVKRITGRLQNL